MMVDEDVIENITNVTYNKILDIRKELNIVPVNSDYVSLRAASDLADISLSSVYIDHAMKEQEIADIKNSQRKETTEIIAYAVCGAIALIVVAYMIISNVG